MHCTYNVTLARSRNHYCSGNSTRPNVFLFLSTLSHKQHDFRGKAIEHKMYVLVFPTTMSETLLILRRNERNIISLRKYSCIKYLSFLRACTGTSYFLEHKIS